MDQIDPARQCLSEVAQKARDAKQASHFLALASATMKNAALGAMAGALRSDTDQIMSANSQDVSAARLSGMDDSMIDRLVLTEARIEGMAAALENLINLPDPIMQ